MTKIKTAMMAVALAAVQLAAELADTLGCRKVESVAAFGQMPIPSVQRVKKLRPVL